MAIVQRMGTPGLGMSLLDPDAFRQIIRASERERQSTILQRRSGCIGRFWDSENRRLVTIHLGEVTARIPLTHRMIQIDQEQQQRAESAIGGERSAHTGAVTAEPPPATNRGGKFLRSQENQDSEQAF